MKVNELYKTLDAYIKCGQGDDVVMIKTQDPSAGALSSVGITGMSSGFDWDDGHIFINPSRPLTSKPSRYLDSFSVVRQESGGVSFWACPKCYMRVAKDDSYCRYCGTKLAKPAKLPLPGAIGPGTGEMDPNGEEGARE